MQIVDRPTTPVARKCRKGFGQRSPLLVATRVALGLDSSQDESAGKRPIHPLLCCWHRYPQQLSKPIERHISDFLGVGNPQCLVQSVK